MGTTSTKSKKQHLISNKNDGIITVTGYIRSGINQLLNKQFSTYSLWNLLQHATDYKSSVTSYQSIPICIIHLIINYYYLNENENENKMSQPLLTLSACCVGDKIDAKDDWEKYYPATILFIKAAHAQFPTNNTDTTPQIRRLSVSPGIKYLYPNDWVNDMGLFIHYNGCSSRYDEWIFIKKHSICNCSDICHYKDLHFISKPNTQSKQMGLTQTTQFGNPPNIIKNSAGLANLGNASWLNVILQCLYHTTQFKAFIINGKYLPNYNVYTSKTKRLYRQFAAKNQLLFKLHDLFANLNANEFGVVSPIHVKNAIFNDENPLRFHMENGDKPSQFLHWILNQCGISDMVKSVFQGRYLNKNDNPSTNLHKNKNYFGHTLEPKHNENCHNSDHHSSFLLLDIPIPNGMKRHFIVDIYDSRPHNPRNNGLNLPVRHSLTLPRNGKVSDLETIITKLYAINTDTERIFLYRLWGFRCCYVWNGFEPLTDVDDNIACYIIKDWQPTSHICHIHQVRPIQKAEINDVQYEDNYCVDSDDESEAVEVLKHHCHRHHDQKCHQIHMNDKHVISPYAFGQPFLISLPANNTTGRLVHKMIYDRLYSWIGATYNILPRAPPRMYGVEEEDEWDIIFINLPYKLRWVHKDYNFYFDAYKPPLVSLDENVINYTWNYHANVVIEWNEEKYVDAKRLLSKIRRSMSMRNDEGVNAKCAHDVDVMDIYECLDGFMDGKKLWALPEVLTLHLPRFYKFSVQRERVNKCVERNGEIPSMVTYPVYNLDLSPFMAEELTMNAKYDLYGVICHSQINHFYALCKNSDGKWYKFEDSKIIKIGEFQLVNNKALILFYKKTKQNTKLANHSLFDRYF